MSIMSEEAVIRCEWTINERPERGAIWMSNLVPFHAENCFRFGLKQSSMTLYFINVYPCKSGFKISHVYLIAPGINGEEMTLRTEPNEPAIQMFTYVLDGYSHTDVLTSYNFYIHVVKTVDDYSYQPVDTLMGGQLWSAAKEALFTDFEFHLGDRVFPAHKGIVAARSSVFAAMFKADMVESRTQKVVIEDIEPSIFEEFLYFLYTGQLKRSAADIKLLMAADKYNVETLKSLCLTATAKDMDAEHLSSLVMKIE
ncbi:TD and POZ domain-containing protein 2-like [Daphnia pulex]|uniref:TD and POZ domain-containing protein 2-like n=1 Tax=Daphnia pulex TaxID=6669 RepID=UPI001EDE98DD|nr:TD and POZ domain-containing protein 2-like [Daphnia pulex]